MRNLFASACVATVVQGQNLGLAMFTPNSLYNFIKEALRSHSCHTVADRNKAAVDDFYSLVKHDSKYSDDDFVPSSSSIYWRDMSETPPGPLDKNLASWTRAYDTFSQTNTLFGNGITPEDIIQGAIGDCWFMSAASALAEEPGRLEKVFLNEENGLNPAGIYAVNFYTLGIPHTVVVDDYLPLMPSREPKPKVVDDS